MITLEDIYSFQYIEKASGYAILFDTDSSFYFINNNHDAFISKRHIFKNYNNDSTFRRLDMAPPLAEYIGGDLIFFYYGQIVNRNDFENGNEKDESYRDIILCTIIMMIF